MWLQQGGTVTVTLSNAGSGLVLHNATGFEVLVRQVARQLRSPPPVPLMQTFTTFQVPLVERAKQREALSF